MIWLKPWSTLRIIRVRNIVPPAASTCLRSPSSVLVVLKHYVLNQRRGIMTENNTQLNTWIEDIVAFHKTKRKFVSLNEMQLEDADHFLICEFKGYDFEILAN
jgi:hypothetical protein